MRKFSSQKMNEVLDDPRYNLAAIAREAGITPAGIARIRGGSIPGANTLVALADIFQKPLDYFFVEKIKHGEFTEKEPA